MPSRYPILPPDTTCKSNRCERAHRTGTCRQKREVCKRYIACTNRMLFLGPKIIRVLIPGRVCMCFSRAKDHPDSSVRAPGGALGKLLVQESVVLYWSENFWRGPNNARNPETSESAAAPRLHPASARKTVNVVLHTVGTK